MNIKEVYGSPYEDRDGEVINLEVELDEGEKLSKGGTIEIEMMDGTFVQREIRIINPQYAGDYAEVCDKAKDWKRSGKTLNEVTGACRCTVVVTDVPYHEIKTQSEIERRKMIKEMGNRYCLTPYKELCAGAESIYNHVKEGYSVPDKVIEYLNIDNDYCACAGIYSHPFESEKALLGPLMFWDGYYYWDSGTAEYVTKYGLVLPEEFISHVMSDKGTEFIEQHKKISD